MIRSLSLISFVFFSCFLWGNGIEITLQQNNGLSAKPGKMNTFLVTIKNTGNNTIITQSCLDLPAGWKSFTNLNKIKIEPKQEVQELISFVIPRKAIAGKYQINYSLLQFSNRIKLAADSFFFTVKPTNALEVSAINIQTMAIAGSNVRGTFLVKNLSNQKQKIQLSAEKAIIKGKSNFSLAPFESRVIETEIKTNERIKKEGRFSFYLRGNIVGTDITKMDYLYCTLIPVIDYFEDEVKTLPGYVSVNHITKVNGEKKSHGWQGEVFLEGFIDEKSEKKLEISLRGPGQHDESDISFQEEYYVQYQSDLISAKIGDHNFKLSKLTEFSRNGRGIAADVNIKEHSIGGFVVYPRYYPSVKREFGIYFKNNFNKENSLSFNYLEKEYAKEQRKSSILSISGQFNPFRKTYIEAEVASGNGNGKEGNAAYFSLQSQIINRVKISSKFHYANSNFDGYFTNSMNLSSNVSWSIHKNINLFAGVYQNDRNAALDTLFQAAPFSRRNQAGMYFKLNKTTRLQMDVRQNEIEDRLPNKRFFRKEQLITAQLDKNFKQFGLNIRSEYGQFKNLLNSLEIDLQTLFRIALDINIKVGKTYIQGFANYLNHNSLIYEGQKQLLWGGAVNASFGSNSRLLVNYQNDYSIEDSYKIRNTFGLTYIQTMFHKHHLELNARQSIRKNTLNNKDFLLSLKYTWNFNILLEKRPVRGNVIGQIKREKGQSSKGIILLLNGKMAIADENGRFEFRRMKQGKYPLIIDKSTLDLHEILETDDVPVVEILGENDEYLSLSLVKGGEVFGELSINNENPAPFLIRQQEHHTVILEIANGNEMIRTTTDDKGHFSFKDLKPGKWKVSVLDYNFPKNLILKQSSFDIEIGSGEKYHLPVFLKKKQRKIQFKKILNLSDDDGDD